MFVFNKVFFVKMYPKVSRQPHKEYIGTNNLREHPASVMLVIASPKDMDVAQWFKRGALQWPLPVMLVQ